MMLQKYLNLKKLKLSIIMAAMIFCCLFYSANYVFAAQYMVWGQVFKVSSGGTNETILPYQHIRIYNRANGALLGQGDAGKNGQYTIKFTFNVNTPLDIECRVYRVINGGSQLFQEAEPGINSLDGIAQLNEKDLKVISDDIFDYNDVTGSVPYRGIVFTQVGLVETPYIKQEPNDPAAGLADWSLFAMAPFGGRLLIYGDFGTPSGGAGCGTRIDWYRVKITNIEDNSYIYLMDPLSKTRTEVKTNPTFKVTSAAEKMGPFSKEVQGDGNKPGFYKVNRNSSTGTISTYYSFPDLRLDWISGNDGLYRITMEYFQEIGSGQVKKLEDSCVDIPPAHHDLGCGALILRISNSPLTVKFNEIYLKTDSGVYYMDGENKVNFNQAGLCNIMNLQNNIYKVEINFTAHHAGGFMKGYKLQATPNAGDSVSFVEASFENSPNLPLWDGTEGTSAVNTVVFTSSCGYIFSLSGLSRVQNGYQYIQSANPLKTYYVIPGL